jgi:uncharacterized phage protein (TIGR02218 family)
MRVISDDLRAALDGAATTFCHCWKLVRRDGFVLGFTDHDRDLVISDVIYSAASGFDASQAESALGLAVASQDVKGALSAEALTDGDLAGGLYDRATVETWLVDWSDPAKRILIDVAAIGEVRRGEHAFTAELRSLAQDLDQERGRLFQASCNADLGDTRCGVDMTNPAFTITASVLSSEDRMRIVADLSGFDAGWFTGGTLTFTSGPNAGLCVEVKDHLVSGEAHILLLWSALHHEVTPGDIFALRVGCDKAFTTCRDKFANLVNFRGFPFMPGTDRVLSYPTRSDANLDGGSLRE